MGMVMPKLFYYSDPQFNHARSAEARGFRDAVEMNAILLANLHTFFHQQQDAAQDDPFAWHLVCGGDAALNWRKFLREYGVRDPDQPLPTKKNPYQRHWLWDDQIRDRSILVAGNHDQVRKQGNDYANHFHQIVGNEKTFEDNCIQLMDEIHGQQVMVLVSHVPQRDLGPCDFNVHGHVHAWEAGHHDDCKWARESPQHLNACVEMIGYTPRTLVELIQRKQRNLL